MPPFLYLWKRTKKKKRGLFEVLNQVSTYKALTNAREINHRTHAPSGITRTTSTSHVRKCIPCLSASLSLITAVLCQLGHIMLAELNFARKVFVFYFKLWFPHIGCYVDHSALLLRSPQSPGVRRITSSGLIFARGFDFQRAVETPLLVFRKREAT